MSSNTFLAPVILLSLSRGDSRGFMMASWAGAEPEAWAEPIMAVPLLERTVLASRRSMFWV